MRKVKFRIWDKNDSPKKGMLYDPSFSIKNGRPALPQNHTLMQYTGIKDFHKKEIYEGDIIKYLAFNYEGEEIKGVGYIDFSSEYCCFSIFDIFSTQAIADLVDSKVGGQIYEVIGNVYEDMKLIENRGKFYDEI